MTYDLNKFVQQYLVSGKKDLEILTKKLKNVPVSLDALKERLKNNYSSELFNLNVRAELIDPQMRLLLLDELTGSYEEADDITGKIFLPYPYIILSGDSVSDDFYKKERVGFGKLITADPRDPTAKVLSGKGVTGAIIMYEKNKEHKSKLEYLEIVLVKELG